MVSGLDLGIEVLGAATLLLLRHRPGGVGGVALGLLGGHDGGALGGLGSFSAFMSTLASAFFLCGPSTMIMLRPSCFGDDSTKPSS